MSGQKSQLWHPASGIRFSPSPPPKPLYPVLDMHRFIHSQGIAAEAENEADQHVSAPATPSMARSENVPPPAMASTTPNRRAASDPLCQQASVTPTTGPETTNTDNAVTSSIEPPKTALGFNISKKLFDAARASRPGTADSFYSHTMYESNQPDEAPQKVKVHYCTSKHTMEHVCKKYFMDVDVLGFDMEWLAYAKQSDGPRDNVSLIQFASPGRIGLFHVALFPKDDFVGPVFQSIMENDQVRKVGVHIQADCTRLRNYLGVKTRGVFELSHLYKLVKYTEDRRPKLINKVPVALAVQVQELLRLPLYKDQSVRSSDWTKSLSKSQLLCKSQLNMTLQHIRAAWPNWDNSDSATDAYAGLQLFYILDEKRKALVPKPELPHHAELGLRIPVPRMPTPTPTPSDSEGESSVSEPPSPVTGTAAQKSTSPPRDARIVAAEAEAAKHRVSRSGKPCAAPSALRSYYIWTGNDDLDPASIAKLLRDPPLQTGTVICYILDSILIGKLPYPKARMQKEVLSLLHEKLAKGRYQGIVQACAEDAAK